jgi:hypothetical protein
MRVGGTFDRHLTDARSGSRILLRARPGGAGVHAALVSFGSIFAAEMGDKSQLMALAFAARYRALPTRQV